MNRRALNTTLVLSGLAAGALLAGCAAFNQLSADVSTYGDWPAGQKAGTYAFERLPSQQARAEAQQRLEDAARPALERAGFKPASAGSQPDLLVQVGARVSRADRSPWDDPLWWPGGFGVWRHGYWRGPYWGASLRFESPRYEREVALLVRERASGKPLYEARASSEGSQSSAEPVLRPLFDAAMVDFPATGVNPRRVTVPLPG
ncbi:DUF4136 domain-containing protein [Aquabacterium sp.]|uniref:DUF4136 domain-containing protein n=1 Tax=Aquabacterium sp. TaxID=1872578 RepID=UPI002B7FCEF7|nr:DUF4136 domain-containing protein [Aquabacterium sp.]HSW08215.1 DUF4136 domain-containing protein [Aquabacterium sp.]